MIDSSVWTEVCIWFIFLESEEDVTAIALIDKLLLQAGGGAELTNPFHFNFDQMVSVNSKC